MATVGNEIVSDLISDAIVPDIIPDIEVPRYIRDIKQEARDAGFKGTRELQKYLNFKQTAIIVTNAFNSSTSEMILEMY